MEMENTQGGIWIVNEIWHLEIRTKTCRCACRWNSAMRLVSRRRFVVPDIPMKVGEQLSENFIQIWGILNGKKPQRWGKYLNGGISLHYSCTIISCHPKGPTVAQGKNKAFIFNRGSFFLLFRKFKVCHLWGCITHPNFSLKSLPYLNKLYHFYHKKNMDYNCRW